MYHYMPSRYFAAIEVPLVGSFVGKYFDRTAWIYFVFASQTFDSTLHWRHNERDGISNHRLLTQSFVQRQIKENNSASLAFVRGIHWSPVNSPHKGPLTRKTFPFDVVNMIIKATAWILQYNLRPLIFIFHQEIYHMRWCGCPYSHTSTDKWYNESMEIWNTM